MDTLPELIQKFMTLAKKAKVLLKKEHLTEEPKVGIMYLPDNKVDITLNCSCFPFFSNGHFLTVSDKELPLVVEKCELFVKSLENNLILCYNNPEEEKIDNNYFLVKTKEKQCRIKLDGKKVLIEELGK